MDAASRRLEPSIGDASLSAGSQQAEVRAPSLAGLAGSLGGHEAASPATHRLEVTADVAASDTASAASWPDDLPSTSASTSRSAARLRSLFLYGSAHPPSDPEVGECQQPPISLITPSQRVELSAACETRSVRSPSPDAS
uniref:Uncharacterized protein n=1 Tax=Pararge aegeria TaxID=116150 RepID=S4PWN7_9NEOP